MPTDRVDRPDETAASTPRTGRGRSRPVTATGPVWTRQPERKAPRLTLDAILATAIQLADREGLDAVSVRRVAQELSARPMSLYSFFSRKDDLVELMVDQIMGEMYLPHLPDDWQDALRAIARKTREVGYRHPWLMTVLSQRPSIGPNAIRHVEQSLAAISSLNLDSDRARKLLLAVDAYTIGTGAITLAEEHVRRRDQMSEAQWRVSTEAYFSRLTETEDFPHLARMGSAQVLSGPPDDAFDEGFDWLLAGFAATLRKTKR